MSKPIGKRKRYGPFVLAAAIYTTGVVAFSAWSYFQQRTNLLTQVDQALLNATHATEQILGGIFIECAVETETVYELGYASNREKLNRFAGDCQLDIVGAIGHKSTKIWPLIAGGRFTENIHAQELLQSKVSSLVRKLAASKGKQIEMQTVQIEGGEELRLAIRYHASSADTGYALMVARSTSDVNHLIHALAMRTMATGIFLYAMALPLILLYNRTQTKAARIMAELNAQLQQDVTQQKAREAELEDAIHDLERFNAVAIGREHRIIDLKAEVNTLLEQMKRKKRYNIDPVE